MPKPQKQKEQPNATASEVPKVRLFGNWTGKTPISLFTEFLQKQKMQKPNFYFKEKNNQFLCEIVISQKDCENVKFSPPDRIFYDSKQLAKQVASCYALFRLRSDTNLRSVLPPDMRVYWDAYQKIKNDTDPDLIPLQYSPDPWEAKAKYEHTKKVEMAASSNPWEKYPTLDIPKDIRNRLEIMIRDNLEDAVMGELNPTKDTKSTKHVLLKKGFRPAHVDEALQYRSEIHDCIDWLSVHVPEDDLPLSQRPTDKKSIVIDNPTVDTIKHQYAVDRLHSAGFNRGICSEYYSASQQHEFHALVSLCYNLAGIKNAALESHDIESIDEILEEEKQVLESIYEKIEHELIPNVGQKFTVLLEVGKDKLAVSVCIPSEGHLYPNQIPGISIHSETLPAYIRLALLQKVVHSAHASFIGSQMIFSILGLIEEHLPDILANPPPLTSLYVKGEKIEFLNSSDKTTKGSSNIKRKKWNASGPSSETLMQAKKSKNENPDYKAMLKIRQSLPSFKFKSQITKAISSSQVVICCGETGCGKSTQLGQFILDDMIDQGLGQSCNIVCTQPRRISAMALADRVSQERCEKVGTQVGYSIRGENKQSEQTKLLFCTTGVLLRQIQDEPTLPQFSHVIIDEVHERGVDSDFLLVLLRDLLPRRPDLKVVLMSATIDASTLSSYFFNCPIIDIPGRTFPVTEFFLEDILGFTGHIPENTSSTRTKSHKDGDEDEEPEGDVFDKVANLSLGQRLKLAATEKDPGFQIDYGLISSTVNFICSGEEEGAILIFMP